MRSSMLGAVAALALAAGAHAQEGTSVIVIEGGDTAPDDLVGQPVYASAGQASDSEVLTEVPDSWQEVGVIEGADPSGEGVTVVFAAGLMGEDGQATAEVAASALRLVPDDDDPGAYFVLFDAEGTPLQGELEEAERDRLAAAAASNEEIGEQSEGMTGSPEARGTDGLDDEGRPIDGGASVEEPDEMRAVPVPGLAPEAEPLRPGDIPAPTLIQAAQEEPADEPLRVEDIADPDAPPIEDATNVVPAEGGEVPGIGAETELSSPAHDAAVPGETVEPAAAPIESEVSGSGVAAADIAPEGFNVADMSTMDPEQLLSVRVYGADDEEIGEIGRWIGEGSGDLPEAAVVDVGGFLGIGDREVAVPTDRMILMTDADGNDMRVYLEMSKEEVEALPEAEG